MGIDKTVLIFPILSNLNDSADKLVNRAVVSVSAECLRAPSAYYTLIINFNF